MRIQTLAHVSDLHLGNGVRSAEMARAIADTLVATKVDHVVVTGDLTHRGRHSELDAYREAFAPLIARGKVTIIPGNHDRLGDDVRDSIMKGERVQVDSRPGLYIVRVDSTGMHNRSWLYGHGHLTAADVLAVDDALAAAPADALCVVIVHHHPLPLREESWGESLSKWMGWPFTLELELGKGLCERIAGRCDLVLHGHRHIPSARQFGRGSHGRPLLVCNAGSSTQLGRVRLFAHRDGGLCLAPMWLDVAADTMALPEMAREPVAIADAQAA